MTIPSGNTVIVRRGFDVTDEQGQGGLRIARLAADVLAALEPPAGWGPRISDSLVLSSVGKTFRVQDYSVDSGAGVAAALGTLGDIEPH